jgi:hypothetical protein
MLPITLPTYVDALPNPVLQLLMPQLCRTLYDVYALLPLSTKKTVFSAHLERGVLMTILIV